MACRARLILGLVLAAALALGGAAHARVHAGLFVELCRAGEAAPARALAPDAPGTHAASPDCALCVAPLAGPASPPALGPGPGETRGAAPQDVLAGGLAPPATRARDPPVGAAHA